jgi:hypothetical protein
MGLWAVLSSIVLDSHPSDVQHLRREHLVSACCVEFHIDTYLAQFRELGGPGPLAVSSPHFLLSFSVHVFGLCFKFKIVQNRKYSNSKLFQIGNIQI